MSSHQQQMGFTQDGVRKDSPASALQREIGNVPKDGAFSEAQRTGATGKDFGIGPHGVQKGSPAAAIQSEIGDVPKDSEFSKVQSHLMR